jgi:hypothetical protein
MAVLWLFHVPDLGDGAAAPLHGEAPAAGEHQIFHPQFGEQPHQIFNTSAGKHAVHLQRSPVRLTSFNAISNELETGGRGGGGMDGQA